MGTCRLVIEPEPRDGALNMAIDEALLEAALDRGDLTIRWYRWKSATVSLGYFQDAASATAETAIAALPMVRRLTGGGAILHHREWTYSCAIPPSHPLAAVPGRIYELMHENISACLNEAGIPASLRGGRLADREATFLCFGRGDPRDIVIAGHKVVGSAQRRRRGAVLQHGSVLLHQSEYAPQFPGILDLHPSPTLEHELPHLAARKNSGAFETSAIEIEHSAAVEQRAIELAPRYKSLAAT